MYRKIQTDLGLLDEARKHTEKVIDKLYKTQKGKLKAKPRTYRKKARKDYLAIAKTKKPSRKKQPPLTSPPMGENERGKAVTILKKKLEAY